MLEINIEEADYSILEGDSTDPMIRVQFRRTQSPFTMTLHPVGIMDAYQRFDVGQPSNRTEAMATPGEFIYYIQKAAIATLPLTMHPQWAEPHTFTCKSSLEQIYASITSLE